jgi:hypothetical protein
MANYTLHLGFNWNSPLIGSIWSREGVNESYRFLQYALASDQGSPAWFQFSTGDTLSVVVWDTSTSPVAMGLDLAMGLSYLTASETYNPSLYLSLGGAATAQQASYNQQYYLEFSSLSGGPQKTPSTSPWGSCSSWYQPGGPVTFTGAINCKLSFRLIAAPVGGASPAQVYISDPEVIVGSTGSSH